MQELTVHAGRAELWHGFLCSVKLAATLHSPASGRYMDLSTNMPGLQFYSGNNLNGSVTGKGAYPYPVYGGLALETQVSLPR